MTNAFCPACGADMRGIVAESCKELQEVAKEADNGSDQ